MQGRRAAQLLFSSPNVALRCFFFTLMEKKLSAAEVAAVVVEETAFQAKTDEDRAQLESGIATLQSEMKAINNQLQMP
mgnify:CR=1 FL=1